jgi:hypothetical protein
MQVVEGLTDPPPETPLAKWFAGVVLPGLVMAGGLCTVLAARVVLPPDSAGVMLEVVKKPTVALGVLIVSVGSYFHFHFFWGNVKPLSVWTEGGRILSALVFVVSTVYVLWSTLAA